MVAGATYKASLAVPGIVVEMTPVVALPPCTPLTSQTTAVLVVPATVAVNTSVALVTVVSEDGDIVTLTCAKAVIEVRLASNASKADRVGGRVGCVSMSVLLGARVTSGCLLVS